MEKNPRWIKKVFARCIQLLEKRKIYIYIYVFVIFVFVSSLQRFRPRKLMQIPLITHVHDEIERNSDDDGNKLVPVDSNGSKNVYVLAQSLN